jgi:hypothetical protein
MGNEPSFKPGSRDLGMAEECQTPLAPGKCLAIAMRRRGQKGGTGWHVTGLAMPVQDGG